MTDERETLAQHVELDCTADQGANDWKPCGECGSCQAAKMLRADGETIAKLRSQCATLLCESGRVHDPRLDDTGAASLEELAALMASPNRSFAGTSRPLTEAEADFVLRRSRAPQEGAP